MKELCSVEGIFAASNQVFDGLGMIVFEDLENAYIQWLHEVSSMRRKGNWYNLMLITIGNKFMGHMTTVTVE